MVYSGDAFMTLKTRVQANPLNTYLSTKPSFASPQPLAAASSLTIPLAITLSDIRLSGFVILVFSKLKGITLVFRNDPLESLKVSSTFDSIPFVRDYLQNEIEKQLRLLFMEDLPAIIHRLSLRLFVPPDHQQAPADLNSNTHLDSGQEAQEEPIDPLASPPLGPTDATEDDLEQTWFSLDDATAHSAFNFSRKNLIRLAALSDSHRTLSLFTPPVRDAVFRAWAGSLEGGRDAHAGHLLNSTRPSGLTLASLRSQTGPLDKLPTAPPSFHSSSSSVRAPASTSGSAPFTTTSSRPTMVSTPYTTSHTYSNSGTTSNAGSRPKRKRKHRIVNLRRTTNPGDAPASEAQTPLDERPTTPMSTAPDSSSWATESSREDDELVTPPDSPEKKRDEERTPHASRVLPIRDGYETIKPKRPPARRITATHDNLAGFHLNNQSDALSSPRPFRPTTAEKQPLPAVSEKAPLPASSILPPPESKHYPFTPPRCLSPPLSSSGMPNPFAFPNFNGSAQPGGILEQAWLMKMASEIARKAEAERRGREGMSVEEGMEGFWAQPPPAYGT